MLNKVKPYLYIVLLGIIFFVLFKVVSLQDLERSLNSFPKVYILPLICLSFLITATKAYRFHLLLRNSDINLSYLKTLKSFVASQVFSFLPGGEVMRAKLIGYETNSDPEKATGSVISQIYLEMAGAVILAVVGSLVFKTFRVPTLISLVIVVLLFILLTYRRFLNKIFTTIVKLHPSSSQKNSLLNKSFKKIVQVQKEIRENFIDEDTKLPDKVFGYSLSLSILSNLIGGALLFSICLLLQVPVSLTLAIFIYSAGLVIQMLSSISPGGLGFTEGGMTGILVLFNINFVTALTLVLIFRVFTLVLSILLGLIFLFIFYRPVILPKYAK